MLDYEFEGKLIIFLEALKRVKTRAGFDLGLILKDKNVKTEKILRLAPKTILEKLDLIEINSKSYYGKVTNQIKKDFSGGIPWIFLDFKEAYLPVQLYNLLRGLAVENRLDGVSQDKSRVILVVNGPDLEKIKIPTFFNLFGPVLTT